MKIIKILITFLIFQFSLTKIKISKTTKKINKINSLTCGKAFITPAPELFWKFVNNCDNKKINLKFCLQKISGEKFCLNQNLNEKEEFIYKECKFTECALISLEDEIL